MTRLALASCHLEDASALAGLYMRAMWTDASWVLMWRGKSMDYVISQAVRRMPWNLLRERSRRRHQKTIHADTGEIVGYARWTVPDIDEAQNIWTEMKGPSVTTQLASEAEREFEAADWDFDPSLNVLDDQINEAKQRLMAGHQYLVLDQLAVDPKYWHQGIGSRLVESGIRKADEYGLDIFIHGKKAGGRVYRKLGFELVGEMILNDSPYGGVGEYGAYFWVRHTTQA